MRRLIVHLMMFVTLTSICGCNRNDSKASAAAPPAKVDHAVKEADLNAITLTPEAEKRLALKTQAIARASVPDTTTVAGEVVVPPGGTLDVTSPVAGTVAAAGAPLVAGRRVGRGEILLRITPLLPAERDLRINAERDLQSANATLDAARKKVARAEQLFADGSGSRRAVDEAKAELAIAEAAHVAARERMDVVNRSRITQSGDLAIAAPTDGVIDAVQAAPGQAVASGAKLLQVSKVDRLWIRVAVYAGIRRSLDTQHGAEVLLLDDPPGAPGLPARRVAAPPTATPSASAVDVVFELTGRGDLLPGERVLVRLSERTSESSIVVPESSLITDIHGGVWVYVQTAPHVFARRRVEVRDVANGVAVLARGVNEGNIVVTTGAAELYGIEFGTGK